MGPPFIQIALACAVMSVGATLQGSVGFGLALTAAPLLALIDPRLVPGPILVCALSLTLAMLIRERDHLDLKGVGWALAGRVPGTVVGAAMLALVPAATMGVLFGAIVLLAVLISASGVRPRVSRWSLMSAGVLSGIMGTTSSIGGPPVAILYSHEAGPRMRGTMAGYFTAGACLSLVALAVVGRFGAQEAVWAAAMLPGVLLGFLISNRVKRVLDGGYTRPAVLLVASAGGIAVILKQLV